MERPTPTPREGLPIGRAALLGTFAAGIGGIALAPKLSSLLASAVPQPHISWQGHVCGAVGGVVAAWLLAGRRGARTVSPPAGTI